MELSGIEKISSIKNTLIEILQFEILQLKDQIATLKTIFL